MSVISAHMYKGSEMVRMIIPEGVTKIEKEAFADCKSLKEITLPNTLIEIEEFTFQNSGIEKINIPDSVEKIGEGAFAGCSKLMEVKLPINPQYTKIEPQLFIDCIGLTNIAIPSNVTVIGRSAFKNSMLVSIDLYKNIREIGVEAFYECTNLSTVHLSEGLQKIHERAFAGSSISHKLIIPESVTEIGDEAFRLIQVKDVSILGSIQTLGVDVFYGCGKLKRVSLPPRIRRISDRMFSNCTNLKKINIPPSVTEIGHEAFWSSGLEKVYLHSGLQQIGEYTFARTHITEIFLPETLVVVSEGAFKACKELKKIRIPKIKYLKNDCVFNCESLESIEVDCDTLYNNAINGSFGRVPANVQEIVLQDIQSKDICIIKENGRFNLTREMFKETVLEDYFDAIKIAVENSDEECILDIIGQYINISQSVIV